MRIGLHNTTALSTAQTTVIYDTCLLSEGVGVIHHKDQSYVLGPI